MVPINKLEVLNKIDEREVEMVCGDHYVKYVYQRNRKGTGGRVLVSAGEDTQLEEILQSVFAVIYTVYQGLKAEDPFSEDSDAEWLRKQIITVVSSDTFWEDDGEKIELQTKKEVRRRQRNLS